MMEKKYPTCVSKVPEVIMEVLKKQENKEETAFTYYHNVAN